MTTSQKPVILAPLMNEYVMIGGVIVFLIVRAIIGA